MKIVKMRTNHVEECVGYQLNTVRLSWKVVESAGSKTTFAQVRVSKDESMTQLIYDSGKRSDINPLAFLVDMELEECTRYYWNVSVWDDAESSATSDITYFETAIELLDATVIRAPFEEHALFVRNINIDQAIKSARLYISGLGVYEVEMNGEKVGDEYLTPYFNDYNLWIQYQTYDVANYLQEGDNTIGVSLGNGWYKGRFGFVDKMDCLYGDSLMFLCELVIELEDGTTYLVKSDDQWKCMKSPVVNSSMYDGEIYDSRLEVEQWSEVKGGEAVSEVAVPAIAVDKEIEEQIKGKLTSRMSPPLKKQEVINPIEIIRTPAGETVLDFGQNMSGWVEFICEEPIDAEVKLQFGEILQEGNFYNENLRTAKQEYIYISNGKRAEVRPHFTFYGFRYMKVEGISDVKASDFTAYVFYTEMDQTGEIMTSNEKVNRLFLNALWGQKGNFLDVPTDCPQRDERMGWTGDAQAFCATASFNMYTPAFYSKYLYDMKLEQEVLEGSVPHVVPDILGQISYVRGRNNKSETGNSAIDNPHGSCAWGDAATIIPWTMYCFYGDTTLLEEQYENMKMWVDYIKKEDELKSEGKRLWLTGFHFADWLALDNCDKESAFGGTDMYYVASAFYLHSAELTAKAAKVLGRVKDTETYGALADEVRNAMQKEYFTETGRIAVDTQTAMALALYFDIVPTKYKERLIKDMRKKLEANKNHLTTGFVGTCYLCPTLSEMDLNEYAYTLLLNEDYPSWLYEVNMGATTIWERWNSVLPNGSISDTGMNSLNHYAYGVIAEWMYRYMAGVNLVESQPGFKEFIIKPYVDNRIPWMKMKYDSGFGLIRSEWEIKGDSVKYEIEIPYDTSAKFVLRESVKSVKINGVASEELMKNQEIMLGKGVYEIVVGR